MLHVSSHSVDFPGGAPRLRGIFIFCAQRSPAALIVSVIGLHQSARAVELLQSVKEVVWHFINLRDSPWTSIAAHIHHYLLGCAGIQVQIDVVAQDQS